MSYFSPPAQFQNVSLDAGITTKEGWIKQKKEAKKWEYPRLIIVFCTFQRSYREENLQKGPWQSSLEWDHEPDSCAGIELVLLYSCLLILIPRSSWPETLWKQKI